MKRLKRESGKKSDRNNNEHDTRADDNYVTSAPDPKDLESAPSQSQVLHSKNRRALTDAEVEALLYEDDDDIGELGHSLECENDNLIPNVGLESDAELDDIVDEVNECDSDKEDDADYDTIENAIMVTSEPKFEYNAPDGTKWSKDPIPITKAKSQNILRSGGGSVYKGIMSQVDAFNLLFSDVMKNIVVRHTNRKGEQLVQKWNEEHPSASPKVWQCTDLIEMDTFYGIVLSCGIHRSSMEIIDELWAPHSFPLYRAAMSRDRFKAILCAIRFDDQRTREVRKASDKAAPISEIWMLMNDNLRKRYRPHNDITIDEQLFPFRGRVSFRLYIPSKPAKYGIKVFWVCDAETSYPLNGKIYLGRQPGQETASHLGEKIVLELVEPWKNSGRNVTTDNFFTTLKLGKVLKEKKLSLVGTVRKNKRFIPKELQFCKSSPMGESKFVFCNDSVLLSYKAKANKNVFLLSTMHDDAAIDPSTKKPEVILHYNRTKSGVDTMDQMLGTYTCKRKTQRWPLALFYNMLDIMALAGHILYRENSPHIRTNISRRTYLNGLSRELAVNAIKRRSLNPYVVKHYYVCTAIEAVLNVRLGTTIETEKQMVHRDKTGRASIKGKCHICHTAHNKQRNTRKACMVCNEPVCQEHTQSIVKCLTCNN